ncbi:hypothetical protein Glove_471g8 [Diversispora epigaea]|uniref:Uncharacterized protein n=1 Tax=Diversispora epigaea TaxID=1348612 RepID=A0A397GQE1_9GLOM|nr:hypothetical protein Glove_471g8 [Diversispora epigaea]
MLRHIKKITTFFTRILIYQKNNHKSIKNEPFASVMLLLPLCKKFLYPSNMSTAKFPNIAKEIRNLNLQNYVYWSRDPNVWGNLSDWDIHFINENPGCTKEEAHRNLGVELDILLNNLPKGSRRLAKAITLKKALEVSLSFFIVGAHYHALQSRSERLVAQGNSRCCSKWEVYYSLDFLCPTILCVGSTIIICHFASTLQSCSE